MICLSAGNPAGTTATAAERHHLDALKLAPERLVGIAATRHGHGRPTWRIQVQAGHPVPDEAGLNRFKGESLAAARRTQLTNVTNPLEVRQILWW
ncbi:hypothetical protein EAV90_38115 [Bradyrhizobium vignae]|nr:hypothetical protein EAV90_38115 [Bradyrhizobium vignae]